MPLDKAAIRAAALAARDAISGPEASAFAARLADARPRPWRSPMRRLCSSRPTGRSARGLRPCRSWTPWTQRVSPSRLPVTGRLGEALVFRRWRRGDAMERRPHEHPDPSAQAAALVPDMLFVPLAAFDRRGHRIGYGAGFYDRTLAALREHKRVTAMGVAYAGAGGAGRSVRDARRGARPGRDRARDDRLRGGALMRLLFVGDVLGRSGRHAVATLLPRPAPPRGRSTAWW